MAKKLSSLEELAKIQFDNLAPDREEPNTSEPEFIPQELEAHFSNKGRAGKDHYLDQRISRRSTRIKSPCQNPKKCRRGWWYSQKR